MELIRSQVSAFAFVELFEETPELRSVLQDEGLHALFEHCPYLRQGEHKKVRQ